MPIGFVFISTDMKKEEEVYNELKKVPEVTEAHRVFGEYDIIAKLNADDMNSLGKVVIDKIRAIPGIYNTTTSGSFKLR